MKTDDSRDWKTDTKIKLTIQIDDKNSLSDVTLENRRKGALSTIMKQSIIIWKNCKYFGPVLTVNDLLKMSTGSLTINCWFNNLIRLQIHPYKIVVKNNRSHTGFSKQDNGRIRDDSFAALGTMQQRSSL